MHVPRLLTGSTNAARDAAAGLASRVVNPSGRPSDAQLRAAVEGQVVLVTGASHGIGRAAALRLGGAGATVLALARSEDLLTELVGEIETAGGRAVAVPADLTDLDALPGVAERILAVEGQVDVVVSNAGKSIRRSLALTYDRFHDVTRTTDVNYLGPVRLLLSLLPAMQARGDGHVVNVSTIGVLVPPAPRWSAYQASKAAFDVWLRSVAGELAADGVATTSIYLALVHTRMSAPTDDFDWVPGLRPDQAADLICNALVERPRTITPWWATAAGVLGSVAP
ncbi:MAG TPA: SDR family NAD(P)-dependent oxidoreductase, partial [Thermoleophilaceae bacterium]